MKYGAVIVAAGMSSRMGIFKPLMKIQGVSMIRHVIHTFQQMGVQEIVVVTGHNAELLEAEVAKCNVTCIRNEAYKTTEMFDSVKIGINYMIDKCDEAFFTPADVPLFSYRTGKFLQSYSKGDIRIPVCNGRDGHPVLIRQKFLPQILSYQGNCGLRGALEMCGADVSRIDVNDPGVFMDADTRMEFRALCMGVQLGILSAS